MQSEKSVMNSSLMVYKTLYLSKEHTMYNKIVLPLCMKLDSADTTNQSDVQEHSAAFF